MANDVYDPPSPYRLTEKYNLRNRNLSIVSDIRRRSRIIIRLTIRQIRVPYFRSSLAVYEYHQNRREATRYKSKGFLCLPCLDLIS